MVSSLLCSQNSMPKTQQPVSEAIKNAYTTVDVAPLRIPNSASGNSYIRCSGCDRHMRLGHMPPDEAMDLNLRTTLLGSGSLI